MLHKIQTDSTSAKGKYLYLPSLKANSMALDALKDVVRKITKSTSVDKHLVEEVVRDIQRALLKADVNVRQVKEISDAIKKRALSEDVLPTFNAREHIIKIVYEELMRGIGEGLEIPLKKSKIMLVGLQGSGNHYNSKAC